MFSLLIKIRGRIYPILSYSTINSSTNILFYVGAQMFVEQILKKS